jgi:ribosomal protein S18 acetylase RimI-like enzyme
VGVTIETAAQVTDELVEAVARLLPLLSAARPPTAAELTAMIDSDGSQLFVARVDGRIVGVLTLATYPTLTGTKAWIEDVIVDEAARGHGVGEALNQAALETARRRGIRSVDLTSRPARQAANRLYQRIGFEQRTTNVYRLKL